MGEQRDPAPPASLLRDDLLRGVVDGRPPLERLDGPSAGENIGTNPYAADARDAVVRRMGVYSWSSSTCPTPVPRPGATSGFRRRGNQLTRGSASAPLVCSGAKSARVICSVTAAVRDI
jgi:hypothetical protein